MSSLLAIDTTGESCSCAFRREGTLDVRVERAPRDHTRRLLPMIEALLAEHGTTFADLDAVIRTEAAVGDYDQTI